MKKIRRAVSFAIAWVMILTTMSALFITASAAGTEIVKDGLVAWYDGSNNDNGAQNKESIVWKDLTGNGNHMYVKVDDNNYWDDGAYYVKNTSNYFPNTLLEVVNGNAYTIEFAAGDLEYTATDWITFVASENDELSLFVRSNEGNLEYKYNDNNRDRPVAVNGFDLFDNSTVSVTFDFPGGICKVFVDGEKVAEGVPQHTNIVDHFFFGNEDPRRAWSGYVHAFRFYDRALTEDEIKNNADADNEKYRSGKPYSPKKEYSADNADVFVPDNTFKNNVIKFGANIPVLSPVGGFGGTDMYGSHRGAKLAVEDLSEASVDVYYKKYARMIGADAVDMSDVRYVVVKLVAEDCFFEDSVITVVSGNSWNKWEEFTYSGHATSFPECNGNVEYLVFSTSDSYGDLSKLKLTFSMFEKNNPIYLYEIAFFGNKTEMENYIEKSEKVEQTNENENDKAPNNSKEGDWIVPAVIGAVALAVATVVVIIVAKKRRAK